MMQSSCHTLIAWFNIALGFCLAAFMLSGCTSLRPVGRSCAFSQVAYPIGSQADDLSSLPTHNFQRMMTQSLNDRDAGAPSAQDPWQWLVLSGGGQWGAFGAGFLKGWSDHGDRPHFDVVTGVSTGALIAPFAFLGQSYDDSLLQSFKINSEKDLIRRRGWLSLLGSNSVYSTTSLSLRIRAQIRHLNMIEALKSENMSGRKLLIGVVNADNGTFYAVDLTNLASQTRLPVEAREECMADYMLASSGVPVAFSPTFIEGQMLLDGSARTSVFVGDLSTIARLYGTRAVNIYVIKNGNVKIRQDNVRNRIPSIAYRTVEIILDQIGDESLRSIIEQPRLKGRTRFVATDSVKCDSDTPDIRTKLFVPEFMACLINEGRRMGSLGDDRWFNTTALKSK